MTSGNTANNQDFSMLPEGFLILDEMGKTFQVADGTLKPVSLSDVDNNVAKSGAESNSQALVDTGMEEPMLQPPPLAVLKKTASFYFHPDDEEEVGLMAEKNLEQPNIRQFSVQKIVEKIVENFQLTIGLEEKKKFSQMLLAFMRDRRSGAETEQLLIEPVEKAGMGFSPTLVGGIMTFINQVKEKIVKEGGLVVDETQVKVEAIVQPKIQAKETVDSSVSPKRKTSVVEEIARQVREEMAKKNGQPPEEQKEIDKPSIQEEYKSVNSNIDRIKMETVNNDNGFVPPVIKKEEQKSAPVPAPQNLSRFVSQSKQIFRDVKIDSRSVGPIDELALMNLATFRRLSPDVGVACQKISTIINSLGKQSLARKTMGIKAWRSSPLYKQYLLVGQMSMESGKPIPDVIKEFIDTHGDGLSLSEFEAVGDVNRLIRI